MAVPLHKKYLLGDFQLEPDTHVLRHGDAPIPLSKKRFQVLLFLIEHHDRLVTRQELLDLFWERSAVYDENLTKCISEIRKALNDQKKPHRFIETVPAVGYRYTGPLEEAALQYEASSFEIERTRGVRVIIEEDDGQDDAALANEKVFPLPSLAHSPAKSLPLSKTVRTSRFVPLVLACIALAAGALVIYRANTRATESRPTLIRSVAVLPLKNLTGDPSNEYFSDGMTESLMTTLSHIEGLKVVSRSAAFRFKGTEIEPREAGRQLGVASVLEGSVRTEGDSVRVILRLVDTDDGQILWANETSERNLRDVFALQDEIARHVAAGLKVELSGETERRLARRSTENFEAYQLYLKGNYHRNKSTLEGLHRGVEYFNQAVARDPNYALAYAGLAGSYVALGIDYVSPSEAFPKAKGYALKALELDEALGEAHYALGAVNFYYEWDWPAAQSELERTLELNPQAVETNACYLHSLDSLGKPEEAIAQVRRALELNPLSKAIHGELGCASYYARQYDQAIELSRQTLEMDSDFSFAHYHIARAYGQKRMHREAIAELNQIVEFSERSPMVITELGYNYAAAGDTAEARKLLAELSGRAARGEFVDPYPIAFICVALGENDQALDWLQKAYEARSSWMPWLKVEPKFDSLRANPRFTALLARAGLL